MVTFLSRLLGYASKDERDGATLDDPEAHTIAPGRDQAAFLRALPSLFPASACLFFEGTTARAFSDWLKSHSVSAPLKIAVDTIWPRPDYYHLPLHPNLIAEAADLIEREGIAFPSIHIKVHDGKRVLLHWHDAFGDDPILIASSVPTDRVLTFARAIGSTDVRPGPAT